MAPQCHLACTWSFHGLRALSSGVIIVNSYYGSKGKRVDDVRRGKLWRAIWRVVKVIRGLLQLHSEMDEWTDETLHYVYYDMLIDVIFLMLLGNHALHSTSSRSDRLQNYTLLLAVCLHVGPCVWKQGSLEKHSDKYWSRLFGSKTDAGENLYSSPNIISTGRWVGHAERLGI